MFECINPYERKVESKTDIPNSTHYGLDLYELSKILLFILESKLV